MRSFFSTCIYFCILLIIFTLVVNFVEGLGAFPMTTEIGTQVTEENALQTITGFTDGMENIWAMVVGVSGIAAIALAALTKSIIPIGIHIYSTIFWTSWTRMHSIVAGVEYIPDDLWLIFWVVIIFLFIASIIGLTTGAN